MHFCAWTGPSLYYSKVWQDQYAHLWFATDKFDYYWHAWAKTNYYWCCFPRTFSEPPSASYFASIFAKQLAVWWVFQYLRRMFSWALRIVPFLRTLHPLMTLSSAVLSCFLPQLVSKVLSLSLYEMAEELPIFLKFQFYISSLNFWFWRVKTRNWD